MNTLLGLLIIAVGSFCQSSSYVPIKKVKEWSWESFWLVQGIFAWLVFPLLGALLAVPAGAPSFWKSPAIMRAWGRCIWTRPPRGQVDPVKERQADNLALANLTETRTGICHARGMDFPTLARQRQREERLLRDLGLGAQSGTSSPDTKDAVTETAEETDA